MADVHSEVATEDLSKSIARVVWGLLLIWTGAAVLLSWGWAVAFLGAGIILLGAQAVRKYRRLEVDGLGLIAGALFVICGAASLFQVPVDLFPVLCVLAGVVLLVQAWTKRAHHASGREADARAPSHPRA